MHRLKRPAQNRKTSRLTGAGRLLDSGAHGVAQDPGRGTDSLARSAHGSVEEGERHPCQTGKVEKGPEGRTSPDRADPQQPARVRLDCEGLRHVDGSAEVRASEG